jgi:hypothetical protein
MSYKILPSQQGPVIQKDDGEIIFLSQFGHLVELLGEDPDLIKNIKDFLAQKIRETLELEIQGLYEPTPGVGSFVPYLNSIGTLREFEYSALPTFQQADNQSE